MIIIARSVPSSISNKIIIILFIYEVLFIILIILYISIKLKHTQIKPSNTKDI